MSIKVTSTYARISTKGTADNLDKVCADTGEFIARKAKARAPVRTGNYASKFRVKKYEKNRYVVYNANFRLMHLLEDGHRTKDGAGYARPQPHFIPAYKQGKERHMRNLKKMDLGLGVDYVTMT